MVAALALGAAFVYCSYSSSSRGPAVCHGPPRCIAMSVAAKLVAVTVAGLLVTAGAWTCPEGYACKGRTSTEFGIGALIYF